MSPLQRFSAIVRVLIHAVATMSGGNRLSFQMIGFIVARCNSITHRVARIAARVQAGTYSPPRSTPHRKPAERKARQPSKLPHQRGWLLKMLPDAASANCYRIHLEHLLRDPEMRR